MKEERKKERKKTKKKKAVEIAQTVTNTTRGNYTTPTILSRKNKLLSIRLITSSYFSDFDSVFTRGRREEGVLAKKKGGGKNKGKKMFVSFHPFF